MKSNRQNVILSIIFVLVFPEDYRIVGVLVATIITDLLICHVVEPYVLFRHGLKKSLSSYYVKNYVLIILFGALLFGMDKIMVTLDGRFLQLLANAGIAVLTAAAVTALALLLDRDFRTYTGKLIRRRGRA